MKHTVSDLYQMQAMPLEQKVIMTENRIRQWVERYGLDGVYVSFSGGKDSTVLLDIARRLYPDILAVFLDTGLEYPEVRDFVKTYDNVEWLRPKKNFKQVIEEYGYPFISKEVSETTHAAKGYLDTLVDSGAVPPPETFLTDLSDRKKNLELEELAELLDDRLKGRKGGQNQRLAMMLGMLTKDKEHRVQANPSRDIKSNYSYEKYAFLLYAPFEVSSRCCDVMKKAPAHAFGLKTGRKMISGQMAAESRLRKMQWFQHGCNGFDMKTPVSNPMAFWTEQDVLLYIKGHNLPIASVYGEIVEDSSLTQKTLDGDVPMLETTGCKRTGCMFCGFGCNFDKSPSRFESMKETHPKQYDYIMRPKEQGGLNYKEVIDWINEHGNLGIKY